MDEQAIKDLHGEQGNWLARHRVSLVKESLESCGIGTRSTVIDLGAGSGFGSAEISELATCDALEPSSFFARAITNKSAARAVFEDSIPPVSSHVFDIYDAAVMMDVLEHLEYEDDALLWIRSILRSPESLLVVTVPAYNWLFSSHDRAVHHFRRYSRKSLVHALSDSGFIVEKVSYFVTFLFPLSLIARLASEISQRVMLSPPKKASSSVPYVLEKLFAGVCRWERQLLKKTTLPFGLSLLAVARRGN